MPAWITSLLRALVSEPNRPSFSTIRVSRPSRARARATARPTTPAPTTTQSTTSITRSRWAEGRSCRLHEAAEPGQPRGLGIGVAEQHVDHGQALEAPAGAVLFGDADAA